MKIQERMARLTEDSQSAKKIRSAASTFERHVGTAASNLDAALVALENLKHVIGGFGSDDDLEKLIPNARDALKRCVKLMEHTSNDTDAIVEIANAMADEDAAG